MNKTDIAIDVARFHIFESHRPMVVRLVLQSKLRAILGGHASGTTELALSLASHGLVLGKFVVLSSILLLV